MNKSLYCDNIIDTDSIKIHVNNIQNITRMLSVSKNVKNIIKDVQKCIYGSIASMYLDSNIRTLLYIIHVNIINSLYIIIKYV